MNVAAARVVKFDSIRDRIIDALRARSGQASLDDIKRAVDANNPVVIEMQLANMRKRGEIHIPKPGFFAFSPALAGRANATAQQEPASQPPPVEEPTMAKKKRCNECNQEKPETEFYTGNAKCKPCYNARQLARKTGATKPAAQPAAKAAAPKKRAAAAVVVDPPVSDAHVIPAAGAITCRVSGATAEISQFNDVITISLEQLANLIDWGQQALKRAAS